MATPRLAAPGPRAPAGIPPVVPPAAGGGLPGPAMWPDDVRPQEQHRVRGYLKWVAIVLGILAGPTALAAICNRFGWTGAIPFIMTAVGLGFAIALPPLVGATGIVDLFRRLKKPKEGATKAETDAWRATNWAFDRWCILFFGSLMGPSALMILPLEGFGKLAALAVALTIPTIAYAIRYSERIWVIEYFAKLLVVAFCTVLAYWFISATMPNVVQSVKTLANNRVIGPIVSWISREATSSQIAGRIQGIKEKVTGANTALVTRCLDQLDAAAAKGAAITQVHIDACQALDENPFRGASATASGATSSATATTGTTATNLKTFWSGNFAPGKESVSVGNFAAGHYRIAGSGEYLLRILYANGTYTDYKLDKDGRFVGNGHGTQLPYSGPGSHPAPMPEKPVGAVYALTNGKIVESSLGGQCFYVAGDEELRLDVNVPTHPANRVTKGTLALRVEKC